MELGRVLLHCREKRAVRLRIDVRFREHEHGEDAAAVKFDVGGEITEAVLEG